jgi:putative ATPase
MNTTYPDTPLAERMRPRTLEDMLGQSRILGSNSMLSQSIQQGRVPSMIFWGPPGCGKTSLAHVIKQESKRRFFMLSAVSSGVKDVKQVISQALDYRQIDKESSILFIDEIHRFNKSQQDALLQAVEEGIITLIGATTENPGFEVNSALLSRCQLILFAPLQSEDLQLLFQKAVQEHPNGMQRPDLTFSPEVVQKIISEADGDARFLLNQVEWIVLNCHKDQKLINMDVLDALHYHKPLRYDKRAEEHYNLISVLHKSIRGSDPDAAVYWLHRMLQGGEDPRYILRRLMRMAVEDVGMADPQAIVVASSCLQCYEFLGAPEGLLALDELAVYLATAPKSNRLEIAGMQANAIINQTKNLPVPRAFRNAVNKTGRDLHYGHGYQYDHDQPHGYSGQDHLPEKLKGTVIYEPGEQGYENTVKERLEHLQQFRNLRK